MNNTIEFIKAQKEFSQIFLQHIKKVFGKEAYLLGGAPRNWLHMKAARDLDFYVESVPSISVEKIINSVMKLENVTDTTEDVLKQTITEDSAYGQEFISNVYRKTVIFNGARILINYIEVKEGTSPESIISTFASSISMVGMNRLGTILMKPQYYETTLSKIITHTLEEDHYYTKKIMKYYKEYEHVFV